MAFEGGGGRNLRAQGYARKRFGQAQRLGLVGAAPNDLAAWWREFSANPESWNMGQQLQQRRTQRGVQGALGAQLGGQEGVQGLFQDPNNPLASAGGASGGLQERLQALQALMGGQQVQNPLEDSQGMRQDLIAQMAHLQGDPMNDIAARFRELGQNLTTTRRPPRPTPDNSRMPKMALRRAMGVQQATSRAQQLAQFMSKRLRGA